MKTKGELHFTLQCSYDSYVLMFIVSVLEYPQVQTIVMTYCTYTVLYVGLGYGLRVGL
jgi:hypothetical protein